MILYHGTNTDIESIDLRLCRPYKDFGKGFYTTRLIEQARKMANRVARLYGGEPVVNIYQIADDFMRLGGISVKDFGGAPSREWALFVMNNRNRLFTDHKSADCNFDCKYDVVCGPVADDDMTMLFRQYQNGFISFESMIEGMTFKDVTSQYSFHTEKAIKLLKKEGVLK